MVLWLTFSTKEQIIYEVSFINKNKIQHSSDNHINNISNDFSCEGALTMIKLDFLVFRYMRPADFIMVLDVLQF